ncbi:exodeoxyribonuclease VII small subunit [Neomegalonema sp.]|uniref:exodeoxyribonuclease VII small subunit n=1 Tax=Neomegalonema sp. TaxID=2039713 RepID=UPI0026102098|nr:exodeoxyribonuclease VII small subunit [Neomegalonema sp.]MDD2868264.1 exodeoxyribonuclease VII small subunit [Neomegalonema sp.]
MSAAEADLEALGFEKAMAELEDIVRRLERGDADLESAIALYERGALLRRHCEAKLKAAEARVEKIMLEAGSPAGLAPLDPQGGGS